MLLFPFLLCAPLALCAFVVQKCPHIHPQFIISPLSSTINQPSSSMSLPEVWLRGPLPNIPPLLQPVAHALLQAREEIAQLMQDSPDDLLWEKPAGLASPGFHLQHMSGVLDRLFTYARGAALTEAQMQYLKAEGSPQSGLQTTAQLVQHLHESMEQALATLSAADELHLTDHRDVGRAKLPSTVLGLYVHAAEHTMRHLGQLLVTVRIIRGQ